MRTNIHVWHLEITQPEQAPITELQREYTLERLGVEIPELVRFLYLTVGAPWNWYMRLSWEYRHWQQRLRDERVQFWIAYHMGAPVGYFELESQPGKSVEICYFGLVPEFIGQGHGKALLQDAIARAWQFGGKRVWLHTCTLDHPYALTNYRNRGFVVFKEEDIVDDIPDAPIQPWLGANKPN